MWTPIRKLADAIRNDIVSGLRGYHQNMSMSMEQLEDEIVNERLLILKEYTLQGIFPIQDLLLSINCIPVDCQYIDKCPCNKEVCGTPIAHFEIPQILMDFGLNKAVRYIGSTDKQHSFIVYTSPLDTSPSYQKYRKRGKDKPWVYIDTTPNSNGMFDCYLFGTYYVDQVSITAVFKDPRQLEEYNCGCENGSDDDDAKFTDNMTFINSLIQDRLTKKKIQYYRQLAAPIKPNDQSYNKG